eukprot:SAG11_NODE_691_length_7699_cov_3.868026_9_plen_319_part_00
MLGSSVAEGWNASQIIRGSWAALLGKRAAQEGWEYLNKAKEGTTVEIWRNEHSQLVQPADLLGVRCCVLSLSLANEGLPELAAGSAAARELEQRFTRGLRELVHMLRARLPAGCRMVCGGPYPNQQYEREHVEILRRVNAAIKSWTEVDLLIDFLQPGARQLTCFCSASAGITYLIRRIWILTPRPCTVVHDAESGHWHSECWDDAGHPNTKGHAQMFECFDTTAVLGLARSGPEAAPSKRATALVKNLVSWQRHMFASLPPLSNCTKAGIATVELCQPTAKHEQWKCGACRTTAGLGDGSGARDDGPARPGEEVGGK